MTSLCCLGIDRKKTSLDFQAKCPVIYTVALLATFVIGDWHNSLDCTDLNP